MPLSDGWSTAGDPLRSHQHNFPAIPPCHFSPFFSGEKTHGQRPHRTGRAPSAQAWLAPPMCTFTREKPKSLPKRGLAGQIPLHIPGLILPEGGAGGCRTAPGSGGRFSRGRGAKTTEQGELNDGVLKHTQGLPASLSGSWGHRRRLWSGVWDVGCGMQGIGRGMGGALPAVQPMGLGSTPGPRQDLALLPHTPSSREPLSALGVGGDISPRPQPYSPRGGQLLAPQPRGAPLGPAPSRRRPAAG